MLADLCLTALGPLHIGGRPLEPALSKCPGARRDFGVLEGSLELEVQTFPFNLGNTGARAADLFNFL